MIYFPSRSSEAALLATAERLELSPWRDADNRLIGWQRRSSGIERGRLVVFHGNAGQAIDRLYLANGFSGVGWTVYLFEYPGYGARAGEPGEAAIKAAARTALTGLHAADPTPLVLLGESLGAGVACALAGEASEVVAGLVLITPFSSLLDVARHHYPWLPVGWILSERYDCLAPLEQFHGPLAVLLAGRDEIIPLQIGQRPYERYAGPKRLWVESTAGHNTIGYHDTWSWWLEATKFMQARP